MTEQEKKELIEAMKHDKEGQKSNFWNIPKKEEGTFPIRFLPPLKKLGEKTFYFKHKVHWIAGRPYECLNQSMNDKNGVFHEAENCPICNFTDKLYKTAQKGDDDFKLAGLIRGKERNVSRIVVRKSEDETVARFYEYGPKLFEMLYHIITETDFGMIVDPKDGRDFNLTKSGTGRNTNYDTSTPSANSNPIFTDVEMLKKLFTNATEMKYTDNIEFTSYDNLKKVLESFLGDEPEPISKPASAPISKPASAPISKPVSVEKEEMPVSAETSEEDDELDAILGEFTS